MNPATIQSEAQANATVAPFLTLIESELQRVDACLAENLRSPVQIIEKMVQQGGLNGGKRFRPTLLLLAAKATGKVTRNHIIAATAIEMIHAATLVHDDVIDGAETRRHRPTTNAAWGTHNSVLFGDFLFSHAFYLASKTGDAATCEIIGRATNRVCEGELQQNAKAGDFCLNRDEYFEIIDKKTAALCGCATYIGAHLADLPQNESLQWESVGRDLGIAFQIIDDILDLRGDQDSCGKTLGTDLGNGKATLPMILALESLDEASRSERLRQLQHGELSSSKVIQWLDSVDALNEAYQIACSHVRKANTIVQDFEPKAVAAFDQIGQFLLTRNA